MSIEVIGAGLVVMSVSLIGVIFSARTQLAFVDRHLPLLISFAAGVFLVTSFGLAIEVFHLVHEWWLALILIVCGYVAAALVQYLLPEVHHHHEEECAKKRGAQKIIIGDSIHNVADGVVLVASFATSPVLGMAATVSIVIHEALQEMSEFFVLRRAGYSIKKALVVNVMVASTVFVGIALGYLALASTLLEGVLLAFAAGFFFHVVTHDLLLPLAQNEKKNLTYHIVTIICGALLMVGVTLFIGEGHEHGHETSSQHAEEHHDEHH